MVSPPIRDAELRARTCSSPEIFSLLRPIVATSARVCEAVVPSRLQLLGTLVTTVTVLPPSVSLTQAQPCRIASMATITINRMV